MGARLHRWITASIGSIAVAALAACSANSGPSSTGAGGAQGGGGAGSGGGAAGAPVVRFQLRPESIKQGQTSAAVWTTSGATSCNASGAWSGAVSLNNSRGTTLGPIMTAGTYTYGMSCTGAGGTTVVSNTLGVGALPAPTIQLTLTPSSVTPGSGTVITWSTANAVSCTATGGTGSDHWVGSKALANATGFNTGAISTPGEYNYNLTCTGTGGVTEQSALLSVSAAAPPAPPTVTFAAQPTLIMPGQATSFSWTTNNATSCAASGGSGADAWSGSEPTSSGGTSSGPIATAGAYSYTLICAGPGGSTAQSVTVVVSTQPVAPAVVVTIDATPATIVAGQSAALTWSSMNADTCTASGSWSGSEPTQGSAVSTGTLTAPGITPTNYAYTLVCTGAGGSGTGTANVTVNPAPAAVTSFSASPTTITSGQTTTLTWATTNATACTASGGTGTDGWGGAVSPNPSSGQTVGPVNSSGTVVYTLSCTGPGGVSPPQSIGVTVNPVTPAGIASFSASPSTIQAGQSTALSWNTTSATACTASGGAGSAWTGSVGTSGTAFNTGAINNPGNYTFTLSCTGPGGNSSPSSVVVNVTSAPIPAAGITTFSVSPTSMPAGQAASLSWSTSNATSCTGSGDTGTGQWNGSVGTASSGFSTGTLTTPGSYTYTLTCTGPGGTSTPSSVVVNVTNAPPTAAVVTQFTATPTTLTSGQATMLAWASSNATSCMASGGSGADLWTGTMPTSSSGFSTGPITATANVTYTYTLTCTGTGGSAGPSSVIVTVTPPPTSPATINSFTATPSTISAGQAATLSWSTAGATSCTGTGGTGTDGWAVTQPTFSNGTSTGNITTPGTYTYTLNCSGAGGASAPSSVIVNVTSAAPPAAGITSLTASPNSLVVGQSTSIAWSSSSATSCTASGGSGSDNWAGPVGTSSTGMTVGPINSVGNFAYTLTCSGPGGSSAPASVTVDVAAAPPVPTIGSFTASPTAVQTGQSTSLAWTSSGATTCTASGGTGSDGWGGTQPASSTGTTVGPIDGTGNETYTLTCNGPGGTSAPSSVSVTVTATPPPASVANFTATPSSLQAGNASSLSWSSNNADSCTAGGGTGSDGWGGQVPTSSTGTSTGALSAGNYTYTLTCSGPGGTGATSSAVVTVTTAPPAASITAFTATPNSLTVGQSTQLSWTSTAATSCTASGGTGSDGWNGSKPVSSSGTTVGPINTAGNYVYTLLCTGAGGDSAPMSVNVTVTAPVAATIQTFAATPSSLTAGQSASLTWTSNAATSCTGSGGTGSDGWSGAKGTSSTGTSTGPLSTAGTVTYTLTCTGAGGTSAPSSTSVTVHAVVPVQPTVTLSANGGSTATVLTGSSVTFSWSSSNATSCSASGGSASDWKGTKPTSSTGSVVGPVSSVPGIYAYTLTCSGPGGSGSSTVNLTVLPPNGSDCGVGVPTTDLVGPNASATGQVNGICLLCGVSSPGYVVDPPTGNGSKPYATMTQPVGVLGSTSLTVNDTTTFPAGRKVGFVVAEGNGLLNATVLQGLTVETLLNGTVQETATANGLLGLDALGLIAVNPDAGFVDFTTTKPFNSVELVAGSVASVLGTYKVYDACVTLQ